MWRCTASPGRRIWRCGGRAALDTKEEGPSRWGGLFDFVPVWYEGANHQHKRQPMKTVIGRNGEILTRKPQPEIRLEDRIKSYRQRLNIPERNEETFPLFVITSE
jgi:hypothetical protein